MSTYESARVGPNEFSFPEFPIQVVVADYAYDDLVRDPLSGKNKFYVPIEAGVTVINVMHLVTDDFVGGTVDNIAIGDSGGTDLYSGGTDVAPQEGDIVAVPNPKHYSDADYIAVTHNIRTAGEGRLFVFYVDIRTNWRTAGQIP